MAFQPSTGEPLGRSTRSAAVQLSGIHKTLGGTPVLAGVTMDIKAGEFVTLLGPSGSGKTSTLMAVAGFIIPDSGKITVGDRDVTNLPPGRDRDMGIVFQNYALFPHMTVAGNIAYPLRVRGMSKAHIKDRVDRALRLVRLEGLADRKPARLSGGQQQRVALARALVFEPSVLLMDEPMGALDVRLKQELKWEIRQLQREIGATVIYVTHDQNEAMLLSDRVALMQDGRIEQYASPEEIYRRPTSIFAARFLGDSNLIAGQFDESAGCMTVAASGKVIPAAWPSGSPCHGRCMALLRPEHARISAATELTTPHSPAQDLTTMGAVLEEAVFMGQSMRYRVHVPDLGCALDVQQVAGAGTTALSPGRQVNVSWDPRDLHLITTETAS
ncbi:ABC transporter ATP-binding protein [Aliirhizobium smilacinae]|uniref:ABC transporter ATP-binding protein n=1 Tax=Aliirhizobium smilacinae TaxID=1395944 RepID=A0A5C4XI28_9HYPH|nr:ABC transporter ATP-binding protein [Rhizobium smilacinae]TNM63057.1 ABC transporter ATP-binding protein [Rhizobium smilacinae]